MILFDHQTFYNQKYGGISLMFSEIMNHLYSMNENFVLPIKYTENANLINKAYYQPKQRYFKYILPNLEDWFYHKSFPGKRQAYNIVKKIYNRYKRIVYSSNSLLINEALQKKNIKIFHPTYFDTYFLETVKMTRKPFVITVYDLIHEKFNGFFSHKDAVLRNRYLLCNHAEKIIAISESTKRDLLEIYNIDPAKVIVIHLASSVQKHLPEPILNFPFKDFILYVGDRWHYKNFKNFLQSVSPIIKKYKAIVVCVGSHSFRREETKIMDSLGIRGNVIHIPFTTESNLAWLYANARLFVFPSLYEGFGIPLLEAMSFNCPIVCSNTSSFPEVVSDVANTFDPWDIESMTHAIYKVFESETLRNQLIKKGKERIKLFNWRKCGEEHLNIYKEFM